MDTAKSSLEKKCLLLDCLNSGKTVAEDRLVSTNPEDRVHFVPLGENARKVFVWVANIGDAKVWRPNAEVEFISDALGTTVAWHDDKVKNFWCLYVFCVVGSLSNFVSTGNVNF